MRRAALLLTLLLALLAVAVTAGAQSHVCVRGQHDYADTLYLRTRTALTGTWTCAAGSAACNEDAGGALGNATTLTDGDIVLMQSGATWYSFEVDGTPGADDAFNRAAVITGACTGETTAETLRAVAASTAYKVNTGIPASLVAVEDGLGTATALQLSTTGVGSDGTLEADSSITSGVNGAGGSAGSLVLRDGATPGAATTITQPELAQIDGITAGTAAANKALVADSNIDITAGLRNLTATGTVAGASVTSGGSAVLTAEADTLATVVTRSSNAGAGFGTTSGTIYAMGGFLALGGATVDTANRVSIGNDAVMAQGATFGDSKTATHNWPAYSDTTEPASVSDQFAVQTVAAPTLGTGVAAGSGSMAAQPFVGSRIHSVVFDYADVATWVGANTTGIGVVYTLPAGATLHAARLTVGTQGVSSDATYTMTLGTAAAAYDQVLRGSDGPTAMDLKAAVATVYGDVADEWGTDLPDVDYTAGSHFYAAAQALTAAFDCGAINCNAAGITAGAWTLTLEYSVDP